MYSEDQLVECIRQFSARPELWPEFHRILQNDGPNLLASLVRHHRVEKMEEFVNRHGDEMTLDQLEHCHEIIEYCQSRTMTVNQRRWINDLSFELRGEVLL